MSRRAEKALRDLGVTPPASPEVIAMVLAEQVIALRARVAELERQRSPFDIGSRFRDFVTKHAPSITRPRG